MDVGLRQIYLIVIIAVYPVFVLIALVEQMNVEYVGATDQFAFVIMMKTREIMNHS